MARRGRDLAGLAALGALGFMAGKGLYKRPGEQLAPVEDRTPVPVAVSPSPDADFPQAGGTLAPEDTSDFLSRRLRVNPESEQLYSLDNVAPMDQPRVRSAATPRADATTAAYRDASRRRDVIPQVGAGAGRGRQGGPTAAEMAAYRRKQELDAMRGRGYNTQYKKGGAVKAKKMASGGMTSASKRADGIATKGKTKCKMY